MTTDGSSHIERRGGEALSLDEAQQLVELRTRQADLELENRELKRELKRLRDQQQKRVAPPESPFAHIDGRKQTEVSSEMGLLRCLLDSVGDLIYIKDRDSVYRACNKASEEFLGLSEAEQIGKTDFDFFERVLAEEILAVDQQILGSGQEQCTEEWVPLVDGRRILLETKKAPFYAPDGEAAGIVGISRDITARKQAEDDLTKANRELDAFARTLAHDLRSQLTPIIGYAEILRGQYLDQLDERAIEYLDEIMSSGEEMLLLMKDLLTLATSGQVKRPVAPLDLAQIVEMVVNTHAEQLDSAGVRVKFGILPSLRIPRSLLVQVFDNYILNALHYGSKKGDVIEVGGERSGGRVSLYVRDRGQGIPPEERDRVFEVFYRATSAEEKLGTGIGLATVHKIAGLFGGRAWVDETPGGGSTFWFEVSDPLPNDTDD